MPRRVEYLLGVCKAGIRVRTRLRYEAERRIKPSRSRRYGWLGLWEPVIWGWIMVEEFDQRRGLFWFSKLGADEMAVFFCFVFFDVLC